MVYTQEDKEKLLRKISKVNDKQVYFQIFKYITKEQKDYSKNKNGVYILFSNLSDNTYTKISNLVDKELSANSTITTTIDFNTEDSDDINTESININNDYKLKYSHEEKVLNKRKLSLLVN